MVRRVACIMPLYKGNCGLRVSGKSGVISVLSLFGTFHNKIFISHFLINLLVMFSSVSRRTLHDVSPVVSDFVSPLLRQQVPLLSSASPTPSIHLFPYLLIGLLPCGFHSKYL